MGSAIPWNISRRKTVEIYIFDACYFTWCHWCIAPEVERVWKRVALRASTTRIATNLYPRDPLPLDDTRVDTQTYDRVSKRNKKPGGLIISSGRGPCTERRGGKIETRVPRCYRGISREWKIAIRTWRYREWRAVDEDSSVWIIDRVEGNIRERDRNGKQDELIGGWKNRPCFRTMQVIGEENREDNRVKGILERRVVWMEDIREKFGLTREVNHCKTN